MSLLDTLRKDMFDAKRAGDVDAANILGIAIASINDFQLESQKDLTDEDVLTVLRKEEKKLKDALEQYKQNGRTDLAEVENKQLIVIQKYLPTLMSEEEVEKVVKAEIAKMGEVTVRDMGKVMGAVMQQLKGKADGGVVSSVVKRVLGA